MKRFQFSLRALLVMTAFAAIWLGQYVISQRMWERTNRTNANNAYQTMRSNLERSRPTLTAAQYENLRQKIDLDWKRLNPDYDFPEFPTKQ
jgi:hypothetical protein